MIKVELLAPDMSCSHCEATVKKALGKEAGVGGVEVELASHRITLSFDAERTNLAHLQAVLADAGYETSQPQPA